MKVRSGLLFVGFESLMVAACLKTPTRVLAFSQCTFPLITGRHHLPCWLWVFDFFTTNSLFIILLSGDKPLTSNSTITTTTVISTATLAIAINIIERAQLHCKIGRCQIEASANTLINRCDSDRTWDNERLSDRAVLKVSEEAAESLRRNRKPEKRNKLATLDQYLCYFVLTSNLGVQFFCYPPVSDFGECLCGLIKRLS